MTEVEELGDEYVDQDVACNALAACEVLARLRGNHGYENAYTKKVDAWVSAHPSTPPPALLKRALSVIDRILGDGSELRELWEESGGDDWRKAMDDLRRRVGA